LAISKEQTKRHINKHKVGILSTSSATPLIKNFQPLLKHTVHMQIYEAGWILNEDLSLIIFRWGLFNCAL